MGEAVDATGIVLLRLCPGTFANVCAIRAFEMGGRGPAAAFFSTWRPARRAAALVVRGTMVGFSVVGGTRRALNTGFPFALVSLPWLLLLPLPVVEVFVTVEGAYPSSSPASSLICSMTEGIMSPIAPSLSVASSGGRSVVGKGGEEAKRAAICISAVLVSGEPMRAFW